MGTVFHKFPAKSTDGVCSDITGFGNENKVEKESIQGKRCSLFREEEFFSSECINNGNKENGKINKNKCNSVFMGLLAKSPQVF